MKVFVYEYCCCQPSHAGATAQRLRAEGFAMLSALMTDLAPVPDVEPIALMADDFPRVGFPCQRVKPATEKRTFCELAANSDWTIVIAPELDDILKDRCKWVEESGGKLLGPSVRGVGWTADKDYLHVRLSNLRVPTPDTVLVRDDKAHLFHRHLPGVCKPRFGAGSMASYLVRSVEDVEWVMKDEPGIQFILTKWIDGIAASVAVLIGPRQYVALAPAEQTLSTDGRFHYLGGRAPLPASLAQRAQRLALRAVKAVPGLFGYVGVDLVMGQRRGYVIEINPRLTTSYVGLRRLARGNLAAAMLQVARGKRVRLNWQSGAIRWTPDGDVSFE